MKLFILALPTLLISSGLSMAMPNPNPDLVIETIIHDSELPPQNIVHDDKKQTSSAADHLGEPYSVFQVEALAPRM